MGHDRGAAILRFRPTRQSIRRRLPPSTRGKVVPLRGHLDDAEFELDAQTDWDELTRLVVEAWCWRDPESLDRLSACVSRLRDDVERDWGSGRQGP
jgi:hypothetical protein